MAQQQTFGVKHKDTGLFFAGFTVTHEPTWGAECDAKHFDKDGASQQALLFTSFGIKAQKKPVAL